MLPPLPPTPPKSGAGYFEWSVIVCVVGESGQSCDSMIDAFCVRWSTCIWMYFVAIWRLSWVSFCLGRCWWSRLDLRQFGLICIDSVIFFIDLGIFYMIATIGQVGAGSDRFRNIWWTGFVESNWIIWFLWFRAVLMDLSGFQSIRLELCWLGMTWKDCGGFRG